MENEIDSRLNILAEEQPQLMDIYSEEDLIRLKIIKTLVDDFGVNLAGIAIIMEFVEGLDEISLIINSINETNMRSRKNMLDEKLKSLLSKVIS